VHHRAREDAFASAVTQINKSATWDIKGIVPAVRVSVFPFSLDPFEDLEERFKLDLSISQIDLFEAFLVPLAPTLRLAYRTGEITGNNIEKLGTTFDLGHAFFAYISPNELITLVNDFRVRLDACCYLGWALIR